MDSVLSATPSMYSVRCKLLCVYHVSVTNTE